MFSLDLGNLLVHIKMDDTLFGKSILGVQKTITNATNNILRQTKRLAIGATAYGVASVKAFSSFEEQMAFVSTMLNDHTMNLMPKYSRAVRNMSVGFGESTQTISRGLYNILSASVEPSKALGVLNTALTAARAGMTDTATTTYALTGIMNAYGMSANEVGKISDILFATVKKGQTTFAQLAPVIGRVTSIGASAGVKLEEVSAALATITRSGISTDQAVTFLRSSLIALQGKGEDNIKMAKEFGLNLSAAGLRAEGLAGMIEKLTQLSDEQVKQIFTDIRSRQALIVLLGKQKDFMRDVDFVTHSAGMTQEAYEKLSDKLAQTMRRLWQVIKYVSVSVGSRLAPSVQALSKRFIESRDVIENWAVKITDRVVFVGEVIVEFAKLLKTNFNQEFQNVLKVFIGLLEAAGRTAVNLALRTGKGIAKAMKAGILGDDLGKDELFRRTNELYKEWGGLKRKLTKEEIKAAGAFAPVLKPADMELWDKATAEVIAKHEGRFVESVFKGFPEDVKRYYEDFKTDVTANMGDVSKIIDNLFQKLKFKDKMHEMTVWWNKLKEDSAVYINATKKAMTPLLQMAGFGSLLAKSMGEVNDAAKKVENSVVEVNKEIQDMLDAIQWEIDAIPYINQGYERANEIIRFRNLLQKEFLDDQAKIDEYMNKYLTKLKELQKAQQGGSFQRWVTDAKELGRALEEDCVRGLQDLSSALTDFLIDGEFEFKQFTANILKMFLNSLVEMKVASAAASLFDPKTGLITNFAKGLAGGIMGGGGGTTFENPMAVMGAPEGYAEGGIAWKPQLAKVAEKEPELITPFSKINQLFSGKQNAQQPKVNVNNKLKVVNVFDREEMLSAMQSDKGEKVIINTLRRKGFI